jgi:hypothetical protein
MVLAGQTLFVAGPPVVIDEEAAHRGLADVVVEEELGRQTAALQGEHGSRLLAVSATDGQQLAERELSGLPVFDGMAAAAGRLYLATTDGNVMCFAGPSG